MGFYIFITENSTNVVATHVALSLPVVTVKEYPIIQFVGCRPSQKTELF